LFDIGELNKEVFLSAQQLPFSDFEDALVCEIAHRKNCAVIVTRNLGDFKKSIVPPIAPENLPAHLKI